MKILRCTVEDSVTHVCCCSSSRRPASLGSDCRPRWRWARIKEAGGESSPVSDPSWRPLLTISLPPTLHAAWGLTTPICTEHRKFDLGNSLVIRVRSWICATTHHGECIRGARAINGRRITGIARSTTSDLPPVGNAHLPLSGERAACPRVPCHGRWGGGDATSNRRENRRGRGGLLLWLPSVSRGECDGERGHGRRRIVIGVFFSLCGDWSFLLGRLTVSQGEAAGGSRGLVVAGGGTKEQSDGLSHQTIILLSFFLVVYVGETCK
jgi:hypothetical protein